MSIFIASLHDLRIGGNTFRRSRYIDFLILVSESEDVLHVYSSVHITLFDCKFKSLHALFALTTSFHQV